MEDCHFDDFFGGEIPLGFIENDYNKEIPHSVSEWQLELFLL